MIQIKLLPSRMIVIIYIYIYNLKKLVQFKLYNNWWTIRIRKIHFVNTDMVKYNVLKNMSVFWFIKKKQIQLK